MTFEVDINGRRRTVSIERTASESAQFRVLVDGRPVLVEAVPVGPHRLSLVFPDAGTSHEVALSAEGPDRLAVQSKEGTVQLVIDGRRSLQAARQGTRRGQPGEERLVAPMPGRVLRVLVQPGDEVALRQPLVVVEAMKMENELGASRPGRVREVAVHEGMSVEAGRLLMVIE